MGFPTDHPQISEAIFSQSVQHTPQGNQAILSRAAEITDPSTSSPEQILRALHAARSTYSGVQNLPRRTRESVLNRYAREYGTLIALSESLGSNLTNVGPVLEEGAESTATAPIVIVQQGGSGGTTVVNRSAAQTQRTPARDGAGVLKEYMLGG